MRKLNNWQVMFGLAAILMAAGIGVYAYTQNDTSETTSEISVNDTDDRQTANTVKEETTEELLKASRPTPTEQTEETKKSAEPKQTAKSNATSKYAEDIEFSGNPIPYEECSGYHEGTFKGETENVFVTSKEELRSCLSRYGTVYVGTMNQTEEKQTAEEYFDDTFFEEHTLAIEVHDGSLSNYRYSLESVTGVDDMANVNINYTKYQHGGAFAPHLEFNFYILGKDVSGVTFNFKVKNVDNTEGLNGNPKPVF